MTDRSGQIVRSLIDTPSGYTYTALCSVDIARRVLTGEFAIGVRSPASAYGPSLATSIADTTATDL